MSASGENGVYITGGGGGVVLVMVYVVWSMECALIFMRIEDAMTVQKFFYEHASISFV